jgi:prefoldin subunit 5
MTDEEMLVEIKKMFAAERKNNNAKFESIDQKFESADKRFESMDKRFDSMDHKIDQLQVDVKNIKEDAAITRTATNTLLDWAEKAQVDVKIPLYHKAD